MTTRGFNLSLAGVTILLVAGCRSGTTPDDNSPDGPSPAVKVVNDAGRLKTRDYLPVLDGGRIELAPPADWEIAPRSGDYLVRFFADKNRQNRFPRIWVTAEDNPFEFLPPVIDKDNVQSLADAVASWTDDEGLTLVEPVKPMVIGNTPVARYVYYTKFSVRGKPSVTAERQVLKTVINGRLYTIDLHVMRGTIVRYRDAGYAVAASLRVPQGAPQPEETKPEETKPEETGE